MMNLSRKQKEEVIKNVHRYHPADFSYYSISNGIKRNSVLEQTGAEDAYALRKSDLCTGAKSNLRKVFRFLGADPKTVLKVVSPSKIPVTLKTGYEIAEIIETAMEEGFGDSPGVNFKRNVVKAWEKDKEYYESLGLTFRHAFEVNWPVDNSC